MVIWRELKYVLRRLRLAPGFTAVALITLAIGIGANSAIFSVIHGVLLKPLAYYDPERLVGVWETAPGFGFPRFDASPASYFTFREENRAFQDIGLYRRGAVTVTGLAEPEQVHAVFVTDGTLPILGARPMLGRLFSRKDDLPGNPETVLLSNAYWRTKFGSSGAAVGRRLIVDGKARTIIGVLAPDFHFADDKAALFVPLQLDRSKVYIGNFSYSAVARLRPGVTLMQANADVARMLPLMSQKFQPVAGTTLETFRQARFGPDVHPLKDDVVGDVGKVLWVVMGVVGIVLFIACANVANLLLVRAEGRQHELAIRVSIGASRRQLASELLLESSVLGVAGGALGLILASFVLQLLIAIAPGQLPRLDQVSIDTPVLLFTLGISICGGLLFGLVPVFKYGGADIGSAALRESGRTSSGGREGHRTRNALVVIQVALALVLLISSGLMIRTFQAVRHVRPGFTDPATIQTFRIFVPSAAVKDLERVALMYEDIDRKLSAIPGVKSVGISSSITMDGMGDNDPVLVEGHRDTERNSAVLRRYKQIAPGYFQTMGNGVVAGRDLTWTDIHEARPVLLISQNLARLYWETPMGAIGKRVRETLDGRYREIVGVVAEEHDDGPDRKAPYIAYWPLRMHNFFGDPVRVERTVALAVRSSRAGSESLLSDVRRAVWSVDPNLPLADVQTMQQIYDKATARTSFTLVMLAIAAGMALLLGLVGIYGVISYVVAQRTREIGIRMALGASHRAVRRMFVGYALSLVLTGIVCGIAAAAAVTRVMKAVLFDTSPVDPLTYCAVSLVLLLATLIASYFPARRATAVDPANALRME
ncbi:MAG: ABC transporter permease [Acidobacteriaceae bacterium]|nr:ABC transporter permease [Acidobacteriaceae bacterium]